MEAETPAPAPAALPPGGPKDNTLPVASLVLGILSLLCCCCAAVLGIARFSPSVTTTLKTPTAALAPTRTSTATARPSNTPAPSETSGPTQTSTPMAEPIVRTGKGDDVVDIPKGPGPVILNIKYTGAGNFAIINYDGAGKQIDLLVSTIGSYNGTVPLDFLKSEQTARLEISTRGSWEIQVLPLSQVRRIEVPGTFTGSGDDVVALTGAIPDLLKIDASKNSDNFAVWSYGNSRHLIVNEIGSYTGTVIVGPDTVLLFIQAKGKWSIEVTTR